MAYRSASLRTNLLTRNNENSTRPGKETVKLVAGPTLRRAALGDIGNKGGVLHRSVTVGPTKNAITKPAPGFKKPVVTKARQVKAAPQVIIEEKPAQSNDSVVDASMVSVCGPFSNNPVDMSGVEEKRISTPEPQQVEEQPSPEVSDPDVLELSNAFSSKLLTVTDIDAEDRDNPQLVSEYVNDIYAYMRSLEMKNMVRQQYLDGRMVTPRMRSILVDWLVQVHLRFNLMQETLYLTIAVLDRYLQLAPDTPKDELQLVGVSTMFLAGKYEEMYYTEIGDFVYVTDNAYTKLQIRKMESKILRTLDFYISYPLPLHFLRRNSKAAQVDGIQHTLAKYLIELCLPEYSMCHYKASQVGAAALCLTIKLIGDAPEWSDTVAYYSGYSEADLLPIITKMAQCVKRSHSSKQQSIQHKYRNSKLMKISELEQLRGPVIESLAKTGSIASS